VRAPSRFRSTQVVVQIMFEGNSDIGAAIAAAAGRRVGHAASSVKLDRHRLRC